MQKMLDPDEALALVLEHVRPRPAVEATLNDARGLVLAEVVSSDRDHPPFDRAMMDGYAVCLADAGAVVRLAGEVAAGQASGATVEPGACVAIMTGAPCPPGAEAVVKIEDTERDGDQITLPPKVRAGHIALKGCECENGRAVLEPGTRVTPLVLAVLASVGRQSVEVTSAPRVAVITTGSELVGPEKKAGAAQIRDSNGPMLAAQVQRLGVCPPAHVMHASDSMEALAAALEQAADADVVLLSGGVSMGRYDLVPAALEAHGVTLALHKVTQKPGKPVLFGHKQERAFFGLPGNPLSSHFCFFRYVAPTLRAMAGLEVQTGYRQARLTAPLQISGWRMNFLLARAEEEPNGLRVTPLLGKGSADIFTAPAANAYVRVQPGEQRFEAGDMVDIQWMGDRT